MGANFLASLRRGGCRPQTTGGALIYANLYYGKLSRRNNKKDDVHLNKHAMHLIRLYLMCLDILEKEEINTYRENDIDLLMSIRNGKYQKDDGTFYMEFFDMVSDYENRLKYANENTSLPEKPDYKLIEEFVMSVNEKVVTGEY